MLTFSSSVFKLFSSSCSLLVLKFTCFPFLSPTDFSNLFGHRPSFGLVVFLAVNVFHTEKKNPSLFSGFFHSLYFLIHFILFLPC